MVTPKAQNQAPVPELRNELSISFRGRAGAATALIYDPLSHRYFELSQQSTVLLQNWALRDRSAIVKATQVIGAAVGNAAVDTLAKFLVENGLAKHPGSAQGFALWHAQRAQKKTIVARFAALIFLRVPLGNPDRMLSVLYTVAWPFLTRGFAALTVCAFLLAAWLLVQRPEAISSSFNALLTLQGAPMLVLAIALVKLGHELGHGLQAKRLGLRVPSSGIMFLLGLPLPFVELSSAWQLERTRDRLRVDAGGILAETAIAAWSLLAFCFWPDGTMRLILFAMASTSLALSLVVNLNPLMRFDGYFLLSDVLGIKNLQPRSLALMKWRLREALFDLRDPVPEPWPPATRRWLVVYAICLTLYRVTLYIGIAIMAYTLLNKVFGVAVFVFEILFFIGLPIWREMQIWGARRVDIAARKRVFVSASVLAGLIVLMVVPMPHPITVPARLSNVDSTDFFAPRGGVLEQVHVGDGNAVQADQPIWQFQNPALIFDLQTTRAQVATLTERLERVAARVDSRSETPVLQQERDRLLAEQARLEQDLAQLQIAAGTPGIVRSAVFGLFDRLHGPVPVPADMPLGSVVRPQPFEVTAFVPASALGALPSEVSGYFSFGIEAAMLGLPRKVPLGVMTLDRAPVVALRAREMSSALGGMIATDPQDPARPQETWFAATAPVLSPPEVDHKMVLSGHVILHGTRKSYGARAFEQISRTLILHLGN